MNLCQRNIKKKASDVQLGYWKETKNNCTWAKQTINRGHVRTLFMAVSHQGTSISSTAYPIPATSAAYQARESDGRFAPIRFEIYQNACLPRVPQISKFLAYANVQYVYGKRGDKDRTASLP